MDIQIYSYQMVLKHGDDSPWDTIRKKVTLLNLKKRQMQTHLGKAYRSRSTKKPNPNFMHFLFTGNPSKLVHLDYLIPPKWVPFNNPCPLRSISFKTFSELYTCPIDIQSYLLRLWCFRYVFWGSKSHTKPQFRWPRE